MLAVLDSRIGRNAKASGLAQENHAPDEADEHCEKQQVERPAEYFVKQIGLFLGFAHCGGGNRQGLGGDELADDPACGVSRHGESTGQTNLEGSRLLQGGKQGVCRGRGAGNRCAEIANHGGKQQEERPGSRQQGPDGQNLSLIHI